MSSDTDARAQELAEAVRAAQEEPPPPDEPADTTRPPLESLTHADEAWRRALEQVAAEQEEAAARVREEVARLTAALAESEARGATTEQEAARLAQELAEVRTGAETARTAADRTTALLTAALTAALSEAEALRVAADEERTELLARMQAAADAQAAVEREVVLLTVALESTRHAAADAEAARAEAGRRHAELLTQLEEGETARLFAEQVRTDESERRTAAERRAEELVAEIDRLRAEVASTPEPPVEEDGGDVGEDATEVSTRSAVAGLAAQPPEEPEPPQEVIRFSSRGRARTGLALLATVGALAAAGVVVVLALDDRLLTPVGIGASIVGAVLAIAAFLGRSRGARVWLDGGTVNIESAGHHRFDLTSPNTRLQMIGEPGRRGWKLLFLRRSMAPYVINDRMVDSREFTEAVRRWRPDL